VLQDTFHKTRKPNGNAEDATVGAITAAVSAVGPDRSGHLAAQVMHSRKEAARSTKCTPNKRARSNASTVSRLR
jgi:hypothetical protein